MKTMPTLAAALWLTLPATAQIPNMLLHSIPPSCPAQSGAQFGTAVAVDGGYVVVGAPFDDTDGTDAGLVQVFDVQSGAPVHMLHDPNPAANNQFGGAVAIFGSRVVVGAANADLGATDAGVAYIFDLSSLTPAVPVLTLPNPTPANTDFFGIAVSIDGAQVVVGANRDDTAATDAGAAYVYDLTSGTPATPVLSLFNPGPPEGDYFGFAVGISGPLLVVGAVRDDLAGFNDAGSAYVYNITSGTPETPIATLNNPAPATQDQFARAVAISGNQVVVGVWQDDNLGTDAGTVFVYDMGGASPSLPAVTLTNPGIAPNGFDNFGMSVAVSGARVVVGTWRDDVGEVDAGCAYVFDVSSGTPTVPVATLYNPTPGLGDNFGRAVGFDGIYAVVGAHLDDDKAADMGTAWIYAPPPPEIVVEVQPSNANVSDGGSRDFGTAVTGSITSVTFTVKNTGIRDLLLGGTPKVAVNGTHAGEFSVAAQPVSPVGGPGGTTTFTVQFAPTSGGAKTAALHIVNNDPDENPFDITLAGQSLAFTEDTDGDGMNDAAEYQLAALGYNWQVTQTALVNTLTSNFIGLQPNLNTAGWYTTSQVQGLNLPAPLLQRHPVTGVFTLTIGVEKSTTLAPASFTPFPMSAPQTLINGAGKLEFQFAVPDNAAFFQLRAQ